MRTYRISVAYRVLMVVVGAFVVLFIGGMLLTAISERDATIASPLLILVPVYVVMAILAAWGTVVRVTLDEASRQIEFRTLLRRRVVPTDDLISISIPWYDLNRMQPVIRYRGGSARLFAMTNLFDLVQRLRELNPAFEVRGL